jgi:hypothetical protein
MTAAAPKLFISYSWTSPAHEEWVLSFATKLRENGVDVILDKWELREGHDAHAFMENMVTDPDIKKVVIICDRLYAEKADGRSGGVGTEAQIMSAAIYAKRDQTKFVAVLTERNNDGHPFLPTYYKSRVYIDLSSSYLYNKNFEQLLRWIYDKPHHVKPEIGSVPAFLVAEREGFIVSNLTIKDIVCGLEWTRNANIANIEISYRDAKKALRELNKQKYGGHGDWRLPDHNEYINFFEYVGVDDEEEDDELYCYYPDGPLGYYMGGSKDKEWYKVRKGKGDKLISFLKSIGFVNIQPDSYWAGPCDSSDYEKCCSLKYASTPTFLMGSQTFFLWPVRNLG